MCLVLHATRHHAETLTGNMYMKKYKLWIFQERSINLTLLVIISSPLQFHTINAQCTKQNQKKPSWRISDHTHIACKQTISQPCLGLTGENGRKRERKNHGFSCILENLPYSKFNMYLCGWVLTFILILTGNTIDLPHFFLQLLTSTFKSVIQRWYAQKASKDNYYFLHKLANFLRTFVRTLVVCVCVGGTSGPHHTVYQCL